MTNYSSVLWISVIAYSAVQGFLLFLIFPTYKKGSKQAKWLLAILSLFCALMFSEELLERTMGYAAAPHLIFAASPFWYLFAPLLFFYFRLYSRNIQVRWTDVWHAIPFLVVLFNNRYFYQQSGAYKIQYLEQLSLGNAHPIHNINFIVFCLQVTLYLIVMTYSLSKAKKAAQKKWLRYLVIGLGLITMLGYLSLAAMNGFADFLPEMGILYMIALTAFLLFLFLKTLKSPKELYFIGRPPRIQANLVQEKANDVFQALTQFMKNEEPFRDPTYDVQTLVRQFGHSKNYLTLVIRNETGLNFKDYINSYRVEDAKQKLSSPLSKQYTIQSIASDSGFNSLATFYRVFKKVEGTTPKSFIKND